MEQSLPASFVKVSRVVRAATIALFLGLACQKGSGAPDSKPVNAADTANFTIASTWSQPGSQSVSGELAEGGPCSISTSEDPSTGGPMSSRKPPAWTTASGAPAAVVSALKPAWTEGWTVTCSVTMVSSAPEGDRGSLVSSGQPMTVTIDLALPAVDSAWILESGPSASVTLPVRIMGSNGPEGSAYITIGGSGLPPYRKRALARSGRVVLEVSRGRVVKLKFNARVQPDKDLAAVPKPTEARPASPVREVPAAKK